ncbi:hypothetical protein [Nannocystis pusilla]|uniref:hypothetical protein n=1 Tax=Nannocystis pusilla TaxID=889268 RepID=UPI003B7C9E7F
MSIDSIGRDVETDTCTSPTPTTGDGLRNTSTSTGAASSLVSPDPLLELEPWPADVLDVLGLSLPLALVTVWIPSLMLASLDEPVVVQAPTSAQPTSGSHGGVHAGIKASAKGSSTRRAVDIWGLTGICSKSRAESNSAEKGKEGGLRRCPGEPATADTQQHSADHHHRAAGDRERDCLRPLPLIVPPERGVLGELLVGCIAIDNVVKRALRVGSRADRLLCR